MPCGRRMLEIVSLAAVRGVAFGGGFGTVAAEWQPAQGPLETRWALAEVDPGKLLLIAHHDEDAEIYLNGVLAAKVDGYVTEYEELPISPEARAALRPGRENVNAAPCHPTHRGRYPSASPC